MPAGCGGPGARRTSQHPGTARSTVSPFCTHLTTLARADVAGGVPWQVYQAAAPSWARDGDSDRQQFERDCREFGIAYPSGPCCLHVKTFLNIAWGLKKQDGWTMI